MSVSITWTGTLTAVTSLVHGGQTRGTITLLRRELVVPPDGQAVHVPVISGNSLRGRLRRCGEELLRDALGYEGQLTLAAAHALRAGGALAKTGSEPLSGARLQQVRSWLPQLAVFGAAAGGRVVEGSLRVSKVMPQLAETSHILPGGPWPTSVFDATQLETYVHQDDGDTHAFADIVEAVPLDGSGRPLLEDLAGEQLLFRVETFPAGTRFAVTVQLAHASEMEAAFFADVLAAYGKDGRLGGRVGIGHGQVRLDLEADQPVPDVDWRRRLLGHPEQVAAALAALT